jgi:hypothetical protein
MAIVAIILNTILPLELEDIVRAYPRNADGGRCQDWCLVRCAQNARASRRVAHKGATDKNLDGQRQQMGYLAMARASLDQTD